MESVAIFLELSVSGGGFIKVICGWQNWLVNPPLQVFFNILRWILSHILPLMLGRVHPYL